ncbi:MAG: hypothetical protein KBA47_00525 [Caldisericia bacterium]|nr:hypothetical protein [Caldisericia bacterium]
MNEKYKIPTIEEIKKEALNFANSIPNLQEKQKFVTELRGLTIEFSLIIEQCFNHFVTSTGKDIVINNERKTLELVAGIRHKKDIPKIKAKKEDMKKLIKENFPELNEEDLLKFSKSLDRFWAIRDIFAHVPINWQTENLEFISKEYYKHFFDLDTNWKDVMVSSVEFHNLFQQILNTILHYHQHILFKKEIYSQILLGKSQADIQAEAKKLKESENETSNTNK